MLSQTPPADQSYGLVSWSCGGGVEAYRHVDLNNQRAVATFIYLRARYIYFPIELETTDDLSNSMIYLIPTYLIL